MFAICFGIPLAPRFRDPWSTFRVYIFSSLPCLRFLLSLFALEHSSSYLHRLVFSPVKYIDKKTAQLQPIVVAGDELSRQGINCSSPGGQMLYMKWIWGRLFVEWNLLLLGFEMKAEKCWIVVAHFDLFLNAKFALMLKNLKITARQERSWKWEVTKLVYIWKIVFLSPGTSKKSFINLKPAFRSSTASSGHKTSSSLPNPAPERHLKNVIPKRDFFARPNFELHSQHRLV